MTRPICPKSMQCSTGANQTQDLKQGEHIMGVIFGRRNFDGRQPPEEYLNEVRRMLSPYGPDGGGSYSEQGISISYCAFRTTQESGREIQPLVTASGTVVTWDGRLDNREELLRLLQLP